MKALITTAAPALTAAWYGGTVASGWLASPGDAYVYNNPFYVAPQTLAVGAAPVDMSSNYYDYSQPINVAAAPPDAAVADSTEQVFSAARDSFKAGDYQRALDLADQVLKQTPNVAVVHEFRALTLFALKRYDLGADFREYLKTLTL